ncbi:MAG: type II secretion system protein [Candidatus Omnitrophota bacterium]
MPETKKNGFTISELLLVFGIVIVIGALMLPLVRYSYGRTERTACTNNLRQVGLALYIYAVEHEGNFPPSLKTLYDEQYIGDRRLMDCPANKALGTPEAPDYVYVSGETVRADSMNTLMRDKKDNHPGGGENVLCVNGVVAWRK